MANISYFNVPQKGADVGPGIHLWLASYSGDREGDILLSRRLTNQADLDRCIDRLIAQLERVRIQARRDLMIARDKIRRDRTGLRTMRDRVV